jgi:hypothetical protein
MSDELKPVAVPPPTVTLPECGYTITFRKRTAQDHHEAREAVIFDGYHNRQRYLRYLLYMAVSMAVRWDKVDENQRMVPITLEELTNLSDADYIYLLNDMPARVEVRQEVNPQAEDPFAPSPTRSSEATSSTEATPSSSTPSTSSKTSSSRAKRTGRSSSSAPSTGR